MITPHNNFDPPVPPLEWAPLGSKPARLISFYLPQFHPIPENDQFWGPGFTEWTNVKKATRNFKEHNQPRIPSDLGYYDLRNPSVMRRQIELAKLYGIGGFCFYFFWFSGKRLLESPLLNFLKYNDLDFPFCLSWANENWTRSWDGRDKDIMISQDHPPENDFAFISYISRYMKDPRYIRVQGKPLLIVYRPNLFPSPKRTAERWRQWCRVNGIGEIYLAYTQSFETVDPREYGFDAAIEFPPNKTSPPDITQQVISSNSLFKGKIYDWSEFVRRSRKLYKPDYPLFRGVCPSWDNTPRRGKNSFVYLNNSPQGYQEWLINSIQDTVSRFEDPSDRLVFINAWNEWGEGAYLEPDQKHGYAYLEATRMALLRSNIPNITQDAPKKMAIIIHAFYPDVFEEILKHIAELDNKFKLFITVPFDREEAIQSLLNKSGQNYFLMRVENRGRDILPFLKIIPMVIEEGFNCYLKVHTKKSQHRKDGDIWRKDILKELVNSECIEAVLNCFKENLNIGMVGPTNHIVPMTTYLGSNKHRIENLSSRMGVPMDKAIKHPFVAGSMFFSKIQTILPLINLAIRPKDFEEELGQVDGTMAHAIERAFAISLLSSNMNLVTTKNILNKNREPDINQDYQFTK